MSTQPTKILGLDALEHIKDYIDATGSNINYRIDNELKNHIQEKINEASEFIKNDYQNKYDDLIDRIAYVEQNGNVEELNELRLQLEALEGNTQNKFEALDGLERELDRLSNNLTGLQGSVLNAGQINEILNTALIEKTTITDDMVETPNVYTSNLVALIGKFGQINAANIIGGEIAGHTVKSNNKITGTDKAVWSINDNGDGWLANGNISWDADGDVTLGEGVTIKWAAIEDVPDDFGSGISIYTSTVFRRTNDELTAADAPSGGSFGRPLPDGDLWSDGIPDGEAMLWASTRVFASDAGRHQQNGWSAPKKMTDTSAFDVEFSECPADQDPKTPDYNDELEYKWSNDSSSATVWMATANISNGERSPWKVVRVKGETGDSIFVATAFARHSSKPDTPTGGDYNSPKPNSTQIIGMDENNDPIYLTWSDGIPAGNDILWASTRTFSTDAKKTDNEWSEPRQMTDTADFEVIYNYNDFATKEEAIASIPAGFFKSDADNIDAGWLALANEAGWTDDGSGDSIWMATIKASNNKWGTWTVSKIKGERGTDGTSVSIDRVIETLDEFKEEIAGPNLDRKPENASKCYVVEGDMWVWSIDENKWINIGRFLGLDGVSKFTSMVFKRSNYDLNNTQNRPEGGDWGDPKPADNTWTDGIPGGNGKIWASSRTFYSDESINETTEWSIPKLMADNEKFEVAWGTQDVQNYNPISAGLPKDENGNAAPNGAYDYGWSDEPDEDGSKEYHYMATAKCDNGAWGVWTVSKIKGEKGEDATAMIVAGTRTSVEALYDEFPNGPSPETNAYIVNGDLYVWVNDRWTNIGRFTGQDGVTFNLYIKYARNAEIDELGNPITLTLTEYNGESTVDAVWMGVGHGIDSTDPIPFVGDGIYKWTKIVADPIVVPAQFRSIAFTRLPNDIDISAITPIGGSWSNPTPAASSHNMKLITWYDGVPAGESGRIWTTTRMFNSDENFNDPTAITWEFPTVLADEAGRFETAYGLSSALKSDGTIDVSGLPVDDNNRARPNEDGEFTFSNGWADEPAYGRESDYAYLATATCTGGVWSGWTILKVKGEKGDKGAGIKYKSTLLTIDQLPNEPESNDDAYIIKTNPEDTTDVQWNHLFAWTGMRIDDEEYNSIDGFYRGWSDTGKFNGSDGVNGVSSFKSTIFKRSTEDITVAPEGGDWDRPMPDANTGDHSSGWTDGIPDGVGAIWSSTRTFSTDPNKNDAAWSMPKKMIDSDNFEVIYGTDLADLNNLPSLPIGNEMNNDFHWYDDTDDVPEGEVIWYMATATAKNNDWSNSSWSVSKIKGENGETINIYIKYADHIEFNGDDIVPERCVPSANDGDSKGAWMGLGNGIDPIEPVIKEGLEGYDPSNWSKYKWTKLVDDEVVDSIVATSLGTYHISSTHVGGKIVDNAAVDAEGDYNYTRLEDGTTYVTFNYDKDTGEETKNNPTTAENGNGYGPAWQLNTDGSGYLAKGNIRWNSDGHVKFGDDVELNWGDQPSDPGSGNSGLDEDEVINLIKNTKISGTKIETGSITANQIAANTITAEQIAADVLTADTIIGAELIGKTIKSDETGSVWEIGSTGDGHLANGNISWSSDGTLTVSSLNGADVNIGTSENGGNGGKVGIGPWKTYTDNGVTYIGDGDSVSESTNVFANNGTFKLGGASGIVRDDEGKIHLGSEVVFGGGGDDEDESPIVWKISGTDGSNSYKFIYLGYYKWTYTTYQSITENKHIWLQLDDYKSFDLNTSATYSPSINILGTTDSPESISVGSIINSSIRGASSYTYQTNTFSVNPGGGSLTVTEIKQEELNGEVKMDDLEEWWDKTTIDGGKIATGSITANKIDVNDLTVKKLNTSTDPTTPTPGTVEISGTTINVYNNNENISTLRKVIEISGDELTDFPGAINIDGAVNKLIINNQTLTDAGITGPNDWGGVYKTAKLYDFEVPDDGIEYMLNAPFATGRMKLKRSSSTNESIYVLGGMCFSVYKQGDTCNVVTDNAQIYMFKNESAAMTESTYYFPNNNASQKLPIKYNTNVLSGDVIPPGKYSLGVTYFTQITSLSSPYTYDNVRITLEVISSGKLQITPKDIHQCQISSNGFRYISNASKYVEFTKNGDFKIVNGDSTIYLAEDKIYMGFNNMPAKEVIPNTKKFRVYKNSHGAPGRWMTATVLTLGDAEYSDEDD